MYKLTEFQNSNDVVSIQYQHHRIFIQYDDQTPIRTMIYDLWNNTTFVCKRTDDTWTFDYMHKQRFTLPIPDHQHKLVDTIFCCSRAEIINTFKLLETYTSPARPESRVYVLDVGRWQFYVVSYSHDSDSNRIVKMFGTDFHDNGGVQRVEHPLYENQFTFNVDGFFMPSIMLHPTMMWISTDAFEDVDDSIEFLSNELNYLYMGVKCADSD